MMEAVWVSKRFGLWKLLQDPIHRSDDELARLVGMTRSWVQKWRNRLKDATGEDMTPFQSQSRQRKTSPRKVTEPVEAKILHLRETLTHRYQRRVGARNILYHLRNDADLKLLGVFIPKSHTTVHDVLDRYGRIPRRGPRVHVPFEPAEPMQVWEMDFTDVVTAHSPDTDKKTHQVELFDIIDTGTSYLVESKVSDCFNAQQVIIALVDVFERIGMPRILRFDRDTRLVSSWSATGFPSALLRFLRCLGIVPDVCPPYRPDLKPYVERVIRTQKEEVIYPRQPRTVSQSQTLIDDHRTHYNWERPNQAVTCNNQPPAIALGTMPGLPKMPMVIDPDAWLCHYDHQVFKRSVDANGSIRIGDNRYYVRKDLAGQQIMMKVVAQTREFQSWLGNQFIKSHPIQGLYHGELPLVDYVDYIIKEAQTEQARLKEKRRIRH